MRLRAELVRIALKWQRLYGVAPAITSTVSEYDAVRLVGCSDEAYSAQMQARTAVSHGFDFVHDGSRYQVKATRPSGKRGSRVTWVPKPTNLEWDTLIWVNYTVDYRIAEAWSWERAAYVERLEHIKRLGPEHLRAGTSLLAHCEPTLSPIIAYQG